MGQNVIIFFRLYVTVLIQLAVFFNQFLFFKRDREKYNRLTFYEACWRAATLFRNFVFYPLNLFPFFLFLHPALIAQINSYKG